MVAQQSRFMGSTAAAKGTYQPPSFARTWLSDPSTYPIFVVVGVATSGCLAFISYKAMCCPTVRWSSATKGQVLRTWGGRDMRGRLISVEQ
jgi:NADH-ubiquinone reductase complex 1 MLRQ subunit